MELLSLSGSPGGIVHTSPNLRILRGYSLKDFYPDFKNNEYVHVHPEVEITLLTSPTPYKHILLVQSVALRNRQATSPPK